MHTSSAGLHIREGESSEGRTIEGYAILFDTPSAPFYEDEDEVVREVIDPSAITKELLDSSDIKFTLFHNRQLLLARSKRGSGTLSYSIDEKGVAFSFDAPKTADGDKALELVRNGVIDGCSFAFTTRYWDTGHVVRTKEIKEGKTHITCRVKTITGIYDMTLTPDPAYPDTSVEARELAHSPEEQETGAERGRLDRYIDEMRGKARLRLKLR